MDERNRGGSADISDTGPVTQDVGGVHQGQPTEDVSDKGPPTDHVGADHSTQPTEDVSDKGRPGM